ncbi:uncharacterized protein VDAG_04808 [Verticillium dahliae VdLs.17]|uniref:Uncharacterized protein n=1 Tax=Verticillium dahliae (strain VdLs.17 / ATCC MYA-4575 / FGSC 10137) TaxID=498257 RepID=G2X471_VERDV|nr:uncharacterized protein VDAG_04808 [Verticillium dahliae VdLs.17]EGY23370.1 hypothetical protein VDAG_04808 [Verticillium dahliae VdLs.17]KAF3351522.1 Low-affinity methionine permease [Verticillium dahliae VDG2]KAH6691964.1 hypothetical protein EV126DRAFT_514210 [Verticillium dahliae]
MSAEEKVPLSASSLPRKEAALGVLSKSKLPTSSLLEDSESCIDLDWGYGPVNIIGYVDAYTLETGVIISVLGISLGDIVGNLKDGVVLNIELFLAVGAIRLYLKNGNEIWVALNIRVKFNGWYYSHYKIISF